MKVLPFEIIEQIIQCFGRCFHYKDPVEAFMISSGVPRELAGRYKNEPKFVWARHVLVELGETEEGQIVQSKILTNLCKLRDLPDKEVNDRNAGLDALGKLKKLATENSILIHEEKQKSDQHRTFIEQKQKEIRLRESIS